jgi:LPXTG-site transpeptidase (sortase) family protein
VTVAPAASPLEAGSPAASPPVSPPGSPAVGAGIRANRIKIATLGIDLAVVEGDGVDTPIGKAAHYPGSAWPGGGSNIYIYGHARVGMFLPLWQIHIGDTVEMDLVDGTSRTYVVTKILPKVPYDAVSYLAPTPTEQLTLQTCTSYYPTAPRFVVIAVPQT